MRMNIGNKIESELIDNFVDNSQCERGFLLLEFGIIWIYLLEF